MVGEQTELIVRNRARREVRQRSRSGDSLSPEFVREVGGLARGEVVWSCLTIRIRRNEAVDSAALATVACCGSGVRCRGGALKF